MLKRMFAFHLISLQTINIANAGFDAYMINFIKTNRVL